MTYLYIARMSSYVRDLETLNVVVLEIPADAGQRMPHHDTPQWRTSSGAAPAGKSAENFSAPDAAA
jgi:hypothetical protein